MKLAYSLSWGLLFFLFSAVVEIRASESAPDSSSAIRTLHLGLEARPGEALALFRDALQTNPDYRRELFVEAMKAHEDDPELATKLIYITRREFPDEDTAFAEAALSTAPGLAREIREAFFAGPAAMESSLAPQNAEAESPFVDLPVEARELDTDIREAIARVTARVEGKLWPEQEVSDEPVDFREPDRLRVPGADTSMDETSLENAIPVDEVDERIADPEALLITDRKQENDSIQLDESKFTRNREDSREAREARKREIAPAGQAGLPRLPKPPPSRAYPIAPSGGDYRSTIDQDNRRRPPLVIRSLPATPTSPR